MDYLSLDLACEELEAGDTSLRVVSPVHTGLCAMTAAGCGAYRYNNEYNVECFLRNAKGAMIYEGCSAIQTLIQAGYALDQRMDKPLRCKMPEYELSAWQN